MPAPSPLSDEERIDWLRLTRSDGVGPRTFAGLLQRYGRVAAAIDALPVLARRRAGVRLASRDMALREFESGRKKGLRFIALNEPDYPPALRSIESAPPMLTVQGRADVLQKPMVAIVGSRNASGAGLIFTERLAAGLGPPGFIVVSGLARGIDAKAHRAALQAGTVAVLAGGHDRIYPSEHADLAGAIAESGIVLTEMPIGWEPRGRDFPRRNRIVSGMALATVVVEAARRSGSLITARFANEQGREVFAVPGSPLDPRAEGTNDLLRQGATLCTKTDDVVESLKLLTAPPRASEPRQALLWNKPVEDDLFASADLAWLATDGTGDEASRVRSLLGPVPVALDDLVRLSGLGVSRLRAVLFDLELSGEAALANGAVTATGRPEKS